MVFENLLSGVQNQAIVVTSYFLLFVIFGAVAIILGFYMYKRTFNIEIIVAKFKDNGTDFQTGLRGKLYIRGKGNEIRFKIWGAKKKKLLYNEEAIKPENIHTTEDVNGKLKKIVFMSIDTEGYLIPLKIKPQVFTEKITYKDENGQEQTKVISTPVLSSEYGAVDVAWLQNEGNKYSQLFDNRDKAIQWIMIVLCIILVLTLMGFFWVTYKQSEYVSVMAESGRMLAEATNNLLVATNSTTAQSTRPVLTTIIT